MRAARLNQFLSIPILLVCLGNSSESAPRSPDEATKGSQRLLYVANYPSGLTVYDIDRSHQKFRQIDLPETGDYKGMAVDVPGARLYLTARSRDELVCVSLSTEKILYRKKVGKSLESLAITPDGKFLYIPCGQEGKWIVFDTRRTNVIASLEIPGQPHHTWCSPDGKRMYLSALSNPYIYIADTRKHKVVKNVGPYSSGIRPFAVLPNEKFVLANVDGLLGFEIGEPVSGLMLHRVEVQTPKERLSQVRDMRPPQLCPSHGIAIRPRTQEVWVSNDVYGYLHVWDGSDLSKASPPLLPHVPQFENPSEQPRSFWIAFSLDGKYCYPSSGRVIDTATKKIVGRIAESDKIIEIDFLEGKPVKAGQR